MVLGLINYLLETRFEEGKKGHAGDDRQVHGERTFVIQEAKNVGQFISPEHVDKKLVAGIFVCSEHVEQYAIIKMKLGLSNSRQTLQFPIHHHFQ